MATIKSENITNIEADPSVSLDRKKGRIKTIIDQDALAATDVDNADDNILLCPIPSNAVILDVLVLNDDLDSNGTPTLATNIGLAYSGICGTQLKNGNSSGDVIDADCFASASTVLQSANTTWNSQRCEADAITDIDKEAWEVAGLSSDPGGIFYVLFDLTTAAATGAAGNLVCRVDYI